MGKRGTSQGRLWLAFLAAPLAGPLFAWMGFSLLSTNHEPVGLLMLFCSGGLLYLIFEDLAPQAHLKHHEFSAIGAVSGFLLGLAGTMLVD